MIDAGWSLKPGANHWRLVPPGELAEELARDHDLYFVTLVPDLGGRGADNMRADLRRAVKAADQVRARRAAAAATQPPEAVPADVAPPVAATLPEPQVPRPELGTYEEGSVAGVVSRELTAAAIDPAALTSGFVVDGPGDGLVFRVPRFPEVLVEVDRRLGLTERGARLGAARAAQLDDLGVRHPYEGLVKWTDGNDGIRSGVVRRDIPGQPVAVAITEHPEWLGEDTVTGLRELAATLRERNAIIHGLRVQVSGSDGSVWVVGATGVEVFPDGVPAAKRAAMNAQLGRLERDAAEVSRAIEDLAAAERAAAEAAARAKEAPAPAPAPVQKQPKPRKPKPEKVAEPEPSAFKKVWRKLFG
jgi:hypothetical protein